MLSILQKNCVHLWLGLALDSRDDLLKVLANLFNPNNEKDVDKDIFGTSGVTQQ